MEGSKSGWPSSEGPAVAEKRAETDSQGVRLSSRPFPTLSGPLPPLSTLLQPARTESSQLGGLPAECWENAVFILPCTLNAVTVTPGTTEAPNLGPQSACLEGMVFVQLNHMNALDVLKTFIYLP